jgi:hypothetical protein
METTNYETVKMIEIMQLMSEGDHGSAVAMTRVSVLSTYLPVPTGKHVPT